MREIIVKPGEVIPLGFRGETGAAQIRFDVSGWAEEYGEGAFRLLARLPGDEEAYTVPVSLSGGYVQWTVSSGDTAITGSGEAQLEYYVGTALAKSCSYLTVIAESLGPSSGIISDAEAWAIGERDGEPVQETDETYHNNAKYYAGEAETSAEQAATSADSALETVRAAGTEQVQRVQAAGETQIQAVAQEGAARQAAVVDEGSTQVQRVQTAGAAAAESAAEDIQTAGAAQIQSISSEASDQLQAIGDMGAAQKAAVVDEGSTQVQRVQAAGDQAATGVEASIETQGNAQIQRVQDAGDQAATGVEASIETQGNAQIQRVQDAAGEQIAEITQEGSDQRGAVADAGTAEIQRIQTVGAQTSDAIGDMVEIAEAAQAAATQSASDAEGSATAAAGSATQAAGSATAAAASAAEAQTAAERNVPAAAAAWLSEHVDPSTGYVLDDSLTIQGAAADAKAAGTAINDVKSALDAFEGADGVLHYGIDGEMSSTESFPFVKRTGNLLMLNGQYGSGSSNTYFIKLTGALNKGSSVSSLNAWAKELALDSGKTYNVRMDLISGTLTNSASTFFEVRVLDSSNNVVQSIGLGESKNFTWASGNALLYLAAGKDISCSDVVLSIFVTDVSKISDFETKDINYTLDYLSANVFSRYGTDYAPNSTYSGTTGNIVSSNTQFITGYIPVSAGDCLKSFVNGINWTKERVDGQVRKIAFYDSNKTWLKTISSTHGFGGEYYTIETAGYIRIMLRNTDVNPQIYLTSILKKDRLVDLIVFAGQSNMAGRGETNSSFPESYPTVIPGAGYEFKSITDPTKLYPLAEPFGYAENAPDDESGIYDGTKKTGDMVAAFVNAYYTNNGNVPTVCVSASEGGSSSVEWLPSTGNNYVDLSNRLTIARQWLVDNGYAIRHQYCAWCQGESDGDNIAAGTETLAEYEIRARSIFSGLISLGLEKVLLIRIGNHNSGSSDRHTAIIQWQTAEAQNSDALVMVSCDFAGMRSKDMMKDDFHYYQIGYNIVGNSAGINAALFATTGKEPTMYDPESNNLYYSHKN